MMTKQEENALLVNLMRITNEEIDEISAIAQAEIGSRRLGNILAGIALKSYKLGVINGKREERARRKNGKKQ